MTKKMAAKNTPASPAKSQLPDVTSVLAAAVTEERARKSTDVDLLEALESTVLRVDAADSAWEKAAEAIRKLASTRAESRMKMP